MESARSSKRRKLETIPESPLHTRSAEKTTPPSKRKSVGLHTNGTATRKNGVDVYDDIEGAHDGTTHAPAMTPTKPSSTPKPPPFSASKAGGVNGLMRRINAKLAEKTGLSPQKPVHVEQTPAPPKHDDEEDSNSDIRKSGRTNQLSQKLQDAFEQEQLERAAKRKPKKTLEDQMREIADQSQRAVEVENGVLGRGKTSASRVRDGLSASASPAPVFAKAHTPGTEKRKPGRPRKNPQPLNGDPMDIDVLDDDDGPVSPSKSASARKHAHQNGFSRALSPMVLDMPGPRFSQFTPRKSAASPLKPRQRVLIDLDSQPVPTNASADLSISPDDLKAIQSAVLEQLNGRKHTRFVGLDDEYAKIANLVEQTIVAGESNSMMVIGARGSGKSAIIESVIEEQVLKNHDAFHVVRLNGFIHTDDKIALRDIWRQLGREMDIEEDASSKNYADTLTTLLALLSHPSELGQTTDQVTKSVVFILDEFDLFTTHPRQTLLYNLFDIAQSRKAPIAVLGLTTRFDVAEALEKRVKSRFSHRHVHLSLAKNLSTFREICQTILTPVSSDRISEEGQKAWTAMLADLFTQETFNNHLRRIYYTTKSVPLFQSSLLIPIATLPTSTPTSTSTPTTDLLTHLSIPPPTTPPDSKLAALPALSTLQLALLISAARLTIIHDTETVTFGLVFAEYVALAGKARVAASAAGAIASAGGVGRVWGRQVARGAWEGLVRGEFVVEDGGAGGRGGAGGDSRKWRVDVSVEEIGGAEGVELGAVMGKWCREI